MEKTALSGLTLVELQQVVQGEGLPKFTAKQMAQWLYAKQIFSFDEMTNLSKAARERLDSRFLVGRSRPVKTQVSADGTEKYLFRIAEGKRVWAPHYTLHKVFMGLVDMYLYAGNEKALRRQAPLRSSSFLKTVWIPRENSRNTERFGQSVTGTICVVTQT